MKKIKQYIIPVSISLLLLTFVVISVVNLFYRSKVTTGRMIAAEVVQLHDIFQRIHRTCQIIDFDYQKNRINFLNVKSFTGSEVGPMNLVHPNKWEGSYLEDNPTIQGIEYQIVRTKKGYFITPGDKVKLPNDKIVGKDIILDEDADITAMMHNENMMMFERRPLAMPLTLK
ncbi:MAG TPA: hypothetical protein ENI08_00895 [Candidatus Dependentiae bacterium]|nr:hypothetical protein [Candidatus Dependentiae bacterium]